MLTCKVFLLVRHSQLEVTGQNYWHSFYQSCLKPRQNSAVFPQELLVSVSAPDEVVDLSSDLRQPDYEVKKRSLVKERAKHTLVREDVDLASDTVHSVPREVVPS